MAKIRYFLGVLAGFSVLSAGCGLSSNPVGIERGGPLRMTGKKSSARLVVGFSRMPSAADLENFAQETESRLVKVFAPIALAVYEPRESAVSAKLAFQKLPGVLFVEPDQLPPREKEEVRVINAPQSSWALDGDPYRRAQWYVGTMGLPRVWSSSQSFRPVKVAVVDTGIQERHQDLQGVLLPGYNAASPGLPTNDADGHGTMVAGLIGAVGGNGYG
ncbi:MAG: S8 family serine peptidase, partial [Candidatus Sericytochromatia bacterium]|nr:S8 family serine peptidase [Candidatus Sericytochromatia bacterium]